MQVVLVAVVVAVCAVFAYVTDRLQAEESATHRASATARAVADSPSVREAIREAERPTERLQPYAEHVRRDTGVTFVTIMDTRGIRWTHPDPERIGGRFVGHIRPALQGRTFPETYTGTLGTSVRVVTPIRDGERIVGLVSAGIAVETISEQLSEQVALLLGVAGGALLLGGLGTYVINARLRRSTHGMNAAELSRMHDYHQAALHAVREGLLMLDGQRRVALINDGARELLGVTGDAVGRTVDRLGLPRPLTGALLASEERVDEVHLTADRVLVVNTSPVRGGEQHGTVVTLRDHTELQSLTGELDSVRGFAEALRSQAHEAANRLHTVVSLIELGRSDEAVDFATEELELAQALTDQVVTAVSEPVLAALLLGKAAQASERGVELALTPDSHWDDTTPPAALPSRDLVTILGNLLDNAVDAASAPAGAEADHEAEAEAGVNAGVFTGTDHGADAPGPGSDSGVFTGTDHGAGTGPETTAEGPRPPGATRPAVRVTVRAEQAQVLVRVTDNGPGVAVDAVDDIFERGWSTKDGPHGTEGPRGLGLALVRQTARRHGGTVAVTESPSGGAEFTVRLPIPAPRPEVRA